MRPFLTRFYEKLDSSHDDSNTDLTEQLLEARDEHAGPGSGRRKPTSLWVFFAAFVGAAIGAMAVMAAQNIFSSAESCIRTTSQRSPVTEDIDITYNMHRFNGSLLKENVYRQDASPEVDAAWEALGVNYRSVAVPEEMASQVGLASDQVKIKTKYGGGFPANVEGLHQLHCLNLLRQSLYYNFDYYHARGEGAFKNDDGIVRKHVSHCLDVLRQQLMCTVDIGVLGQVWIQPNDNEAPRAYVDFNTQHKCRNFDAVRQWAEERQLPVDVPADFLEPPAEDDRIYHEIP